MHDVPVEHAEAGQRVAVNLPGISRSQLRRGDVLVEPGAYPVSWRLDVALEELEPVPAAVTVHIGTSDVAARVVREGRFAQLRLREPVVAARGDRVVLRTETTVGGGLVLDPSPPRRFDPARLELLERGDPESIVRAIVHAPVTGEELQARGLLAPAELARGLAAVESAGDWFFAPDWLERAADGRPRAARRAGELLATRSRASRSASCCRTSPGRRPSCSCSTSSAATARPTRRAPRRSSATRRPRPRSSRRGSPRRTWCEVDDRNLAGFLEDRGTLKRVGDGFAVSAALYERGLETLPSLSPITLAGFRTPSASRGAPPSCCSSATTRTGSPCASATSGACARVADWTCPPPAF